MANGLDLAQGALATQKTQSHVGVSIRIGQIEIGTGRIQNFNADHDYGLQAVHGVSDYLPTEFQPLRFDGTITLDTFRVRNSDLVALGLAALGEDILKLGLVDIMLFDKVSKQAFRVYVGCTIGRYSERVAEGAIVGENATFKFITARPTAA